MTQYRSLSPHPSPTHCGCPECLAWRRADAKFRHRDRPSTTVDATGTRRRLEALACLGYGPSELACRVGRHRTLLQRTMQRDRVTNATADMVAGLYNDLSTQPAPDCARTHRIQRWASAQGFVPPAGWDDIDNPHAEPMHRLPDSGQYDETAVRLVCEGKYRMPLQGADQDEAVRRLATAGVWERDIAERLCTTSNVIARVRRRCNITFPAPEGPSWEWIATGRTRKHKRRKKAS